VRLLESGFVTRILVVYELGYGVVEFGQAPRQFEGDLKEEEDPQSEVSSIQSEEGQRVGRRLVH
jgi:hypothetical protein